MRVRIASLFRSGFAPRTADGELADSTPRAAETRDDAAVLESLAWFESGRPTRNWNLHEIDFYDEVEQIWGSRWGAEGIGRYARCWSRDRRRMRPAIDIKVTANRHIRDRQRSRRGDSNPEPHQCEY